MKVLILVTVLAVTSGMTVKDDVDQDIGKLNFNDKDVRVKTIYIMKLLNHITQPTIYNDIRDVAREFDLKNNMDKFMKVEVVKSFLQMYKVGMLPRGEIFTYTSPKQMDEAIKVFHVLYYAKDFDTFMRTCCWLRERINPGMFVYAMTVAVMHRDDCHGIVLPAPYEIYPYFFVNSDVIHKVFMMKMNKGFVDQNLLDYYDIRATDKNVVRIDSRKSLRHVMSQEDKLNYFTEDVDLNTYYYYFHMDYPFWLTGQTNTLTEINKERYGEISLYMIQQLLARYNLERRSHRMCDTTMLRWHAPLETGYWPRLRLHNGEEMPVRVNHKTLVTDENMQYYRMTRDYERRIRDAIRNGFVVMRDGTKIDIKKSEDIEKLGRLMIGNFDTDDFNFFRAMFMLMRTATGCDTNHKDRYTYIPTVTDEIQTRLRDPMYWKLLKRLIDNVELFKKSLPKYSHDEFNFPGVKVEGINVDKLETFMDEYDMDITNVVYLNDEEQKKQGADNFFVAQQRRLNHHPFKVTIDVLSDKTVDAVVRVFLGPKYDCMGGLLHMDEKRHDMVEIDTFLHRLENGKNTIVRDSKAMHNVIGDRMWTRRMWDETFTQDVIKMDTSSMSGYNMEVDDDYWYKNRIGFPHRLLLPKGHSGGLEMQLYVIVSPARMMSNPNNEFDVNVMRKRGTCRWSVCFDTMPLGFPFDRRIDLADFNTPNMKFIDIMIKHKDMTMSANQVKNIDMSNFVLKRDDLTWTMDKDLLVKNRMMESEVVYNN